MGLEGTYLSIIQVVYDKSTANIILNGEKLKALSLRLETKDSTLAWKIPWMEEPGRLQSMGSLGVGHN